MTEALFKSKFEIFRNQTGLKKMNSSESKRGTFDGDFLLIAEFDEIFEISSNIFEIFHPCSLDNFGNFWIPIAHVIRVSIGPAVPFLAWAIAQLGWIAGPSLMFLFSFVFCYSSTILAYCYQSGHPVTGKRNETYIDAVRANLGEVKVKICHVFEYLHLLGMAIVAMITALISMMAIKCSDCFHESGEKNPCHMSSNPYMIVLGVFEIIFSQIPNFEENCWVHIITPVMSFIYLAVSLCLGVAQVAARRSFKGSLTGISIGTVTQTQKIRRSFQAVGDIAAAYSHLTILIKIQNKTKPPPSAAKTMKKATLLGLTITTAYKTLCFCIVYATFGDSTPTPLLAGSGFYKPFWLLDIGNMAIIIHLASVYQLSCRPFFAFVEEWANQKRPNSKFITKEIPVSFCTYKLNLFRLVWRSIFVVATTIISMIFPFSNDVAGMVGGVGFWPLTVYFPVEMYIVQKKIPKWSAEWVCLQILSLACLIFSVAALVGSVAGMVLDLKLYPPFKIIHYDPFA
ncbi:amino acid permease 3-like [Magnolia sinica]|uniref:amino acid permease 3-like n=1 Tax=Magnolia sinica TaxID=86752 RepID=UPI002659A55D|nr:amino acid permease 3-like [Magnolia sinica]